MEIKFKADIVSYDEAIGGDIVQVSFDEKESDDLIENPYKYILISINYEFPPYEPTIEWCDGSEFDGGLQIKSYHLTENSFKLVLEENVSFDISFKTDQKTLKKIKAFFSSIFENQNESIT
jgi:hypothetical protein